MDEIDNKLQDTPENVRLLNEKLGITSRDCLFNSSGISSINELFESSKRDFELLCRDISDQKDEIEKAESAANSSFETFKNVSSGCCGDTKLAAMENTALAVSNFSDTIGSMKQLVDRGNAIIEKLYDAIVSTDILDPDILSSVANIIHSVRETNDNLIQFGVQKMTLEQQYRLAIETEKLKHQHSLEKEFFKWKLKQQEIELKARIKREEEERKTVSVSITDTQSKGTTVWSQSNAVEIMRKESENV